MNNLHFAIVMMAFKHYMKAKPAFKSTNGWKRVH